MTPIEAAVKAAQDANIIKWHPGGSEDSVMASDIAPIITAFLEAAAGDDALRMRVVLAMDAAPSMGASPGARAILALKGAVNAG